MQPKSGNPLRQGDGSCVDRRSSPAQHVFPFLTTSAYGCTEDARPPDIVVISTKPRHFLIKSYSGWLSGSVCPYWGPFFWPNLVQKSAGTGHESKPGPRWGFLSFRPVSRRMDFTAFGVVLETIHLPCTAMWSHIRRTCVWRRHSMPPSVPRDSPVTCPVMATPVRIPLFGSLCPHPSRFNEGLMKFLFYVASFLNLFRTLCLVILRFENCFCYRKCPCPQPQQSYRF